MDLDKMQVKQVYKPNLYMAIFHVILAFTLLFTVYNNFDNDFKESSFKPPAKSELHTETGIVKIYNPPPTINRSYFNHPALYIVSNEKLRPYSCPLKSDADYCIPDLYNLNEKTIHFSWYSSDNLNRTIYGIATDTQVILSYEDALLLIKQTQKETNKIANIVLIGDFSLIVALLIFISWQFYQLKKPC